MRLLYLEDNKIHKVYKIRHDSVGYPHFLIYVNNIWVWANGKSIQPLSWKNKLRFLFRKHK